MLNAGTGLALSWRSGSSVVLLGVRVLLVEDDVRMAGAMHRALRGAGVVTDVAATGARWMVGAGSVYRLIANDTIEENVLALARRKAELFTGVMDEGNVFGSSLDADDIRELLA